MKLSVCIITYNHAPFIAQAIESALMQRTNFDYQIVIGEDESSDGTRQIVADYAAKYPGKIKALFHSRKDVIYFKGKPTGRRNMIETLNNCTGDYVAMLDGDDYWTSADKLQQQVDFLEEHRECVICAHDVMQVDASGKESLWNNPQATYDFLELLTLKHYPPTCSVVYRNGLIKQLPEWFKQVMVGDFALHLLNAQHGLIAHLPKVMAKYRHHPGGRWTGGRLAGDRERARAAVTQWNDGMIELYGTLDTAFNKRYHRQIRRKIAQLNYENAWVRLGAKDLAAVRRYVVEAMKASPTATLERSQMVRLWAVALFPRLYRYYVGAKQKLRPVKATT
jgi:glycosyltransferase involved in cell wall biosynthesis